MIPRNLPDPDEPHLVDELALLRAVIDAVPDPIFCKDREGRYLLTNRAHSARNNLAHGACLGKTVFELPGIDPGLAQLYHADDAKVLATGEPILNHEEPFLWPDGSRGWYLTSKYPLRDARGEIAGLVGIARDITERRNAERTLHDERQMLRTVVDAVADPIFFKDHDGRFLLVNAAYEDLFGLGIEAVRGRSDLDLAVMAGCAEAYAADDRWVIDRGLPIINREEPFPRLDGTRGWFLTSKFPLRDTEGRVIGLVGMARDITEMRRATEELARARQRLSDHVENSPLAIIEWMPDFRVERWSGQAEAMFGWAPEEVVGKHFDEWKFVCPDDAGPVGEVVSRLLDGSDQRNVCRNRNFTKDGRTLHCVWHNSALRDPQGRIISLLSLVEDVTERVHAEHAALASERHYRALVETTDTGYVVIDERGCVIEANAEYVRQTGHATLDEIRGRCVLEWTALHDHERNAREVERCVRTGSTSHLEIDYVWPDGRIVPIEINAKILDDASGLRIIALCRDISDRRAAEIERKRFERKLQEAQKLESLGVLAGGIAHDFNNLLTGILGHASLSLMELPPDAPVVASLQQIETAANRAADLCQQMLAYSGRGRFVIRSIDLNWIIAETTNLLRASISKGAALALELADRLPPVEADATQLRQVVMNLIVNASEAFGENGGEIRVRTGVVRAEPGTMAQGPLTPELPAGDYVFLDVADNGSGMTPEVRARIFDPFFTTKFTGRGLGLAAVLGIVRGHGGALEVDSVPGRGSTFRILLPAAASVVETARPAPESSGWRGSGTVLVVDDEATVRTALTPMLHSLGFEVQFAVDGQEGIEIFRAAPHVFAAVLLDLTMPRLGGEGVLAAIRAQHPALPVVMMSGYSEGEVAGRFDGTDRTVFLQKPFDLAQLRAKLQAVLG